MEPDAPVRMKVHLLWQATFAFIYLTSMSLGILLIIKGQPFGIIFLAFCVFLGFVVVMARSYVEANNDGIFVYAPPFGKYAISWDETEVVETNGTGFILRGKDKVLWFSTMTGDRNSKPLCDYIDERIAVLALEVRRVKSIARVSPRNTKVG